MSSITMARFSAFCSLLCFCAVFIRLNAEVTYNPFVDKALKHQNVCNQTFSVAGHCRDVHLRFSYDQETKECKKFIYGGCRGNENSFDTEGHCKRVCINKQPCTIPSLQKPKAGCRYDESLNDNGCPKYEIVCDVKPGQCPTDHERARNSVIFGCDYSDNRCNGVEKCCKIGRSHICVPPVAS
uniref:BPTI/Kunitz inhibitor domain-containing protein n=1 Tax=Romanomermis culicivorax TaxID=13658 RepID=A0A915KWW4_ROMCU